MNGEVRTSKLEELRVVHQPLARHDQAEKIAGTTRFAGDLAARRFDRRVSLHTGDELEDLATAMSGVNGLGRLNSSSANRKTGFFRRWGVSGQKWGTVTM